MNWPRSAGARRAVLWALSALLCLTLLAGRGSAQGGGYERTFAASKAAVEKALKEMQPSLAGRLPVLDGFALAGDHPLDRYQRGYFQSTVQVSATASGGSLVHVTSKVTAWYSDTIPSRSGYELLTSNGRLEVDLLDQLATELKNRAAGTGNTTPLRAPATELPAASASTSTQPTRQPEPPRQPEAAQPLQPQPQPSDTTPSAPTPRLPETGGTFSSKLAQGLAAEGSSAAPSAQKPPADGDQGGLKAEADSLEEILKNQSHPKNLVAVKKSGTPVVATPSLTAKTLFLASAHDEFEMLDFNPDWVHVRISGLSRGWIWRNSLEMPEGIPDVDPHGSAPGPTADELFRVSREETASFPGDWEPLRNKNVKIISVQKTDESALDGGSKLKLEFAKSMLDKSYAELAKKNDGVAGVVVIFDSADGGMIAATVATLQQWKAGTLSDSALWHQCYFDPPEFGSAGPSASQ
jgi:hypothetical protein